jgi:hypothetical protein
MQDMNHVQRQACAEGDGGDGVIGEADGDARLQLQQFVQAPQQRPSTCQHDASGDDFGG